MRSQHLVRLLLIVLLGLTEATDFGDSSDRRPTLPRGAVRRVGHAHLAGAQGETSLHASLPEASHGGSVGVARALLTKFRLVAFTSEFGESLRPLINRWKVTATYGVSWMYCLIDVLVRAIETRLSGLGPARTWRSVIQWTVFHSIATMAIPAIVIHSAVHFSAEILHTLKLGGHAALTNWGPTTIGLLLIPAMPLFDPPVEVAVDGVFKKVWPVAPSEHDHGDSHARDVHG